MSNPIHTCVDRPEQPCDACNPPGPHALQVREGEDIHLLIKDLRTDGFTACRYQVTLQGTLQYLSQDKFTEGDVIRFTNNYELTIAEGYLRYKQKVLHDNSVHQLPRSR